MFLDSWAIPVCMFMSWVYMRPRYHWTQILVSHIWMPSYSIASAPTYKELLKSQGIVVCVAGLGLLVASDQLTDKDYPALSKGKGDAFMIIGATLYGFSAYLDFYMSLQPHVELIWFLATSQCDRRVFRATIALIRGRRTARHVGHDYQRYPDGRPRAQRHEGSYLERFQHRASGSLYRW